MIGSASGAIVALALSLAQGAPPAPAPAPPPDPSTASAEDDQPAAAAAPPSADDVKQLADDNASLRAGLQELREDVDDLHKQVTALSALKGRLSGYLDVGWFYVNGDGSGIRTDPGGVIYPQYAYAAPWLFLGDPLSTAINSRGEPATTGS